MKTMLELDQIVGGEAENCAAAPEPCEMEVDEEGNLIPRILRDLKNEIVQDITMVLDML